MTSRVQKTPDLLNRVRKAVSSGRYVITDHAYERSADRKVPVPHMEYVLLNGHHEARKDQFKAECNTWNYAIKGRSPDKVNVRIIVSFADDDLLIVTVINLDD